MSGPRRRLPAGSTADFGPSANANVNSKTDGPEVEALRRNRTGEPASSGRPSKRERPTFAANRRSVPNSLVGSRPGSAEAVQAPRQNPSYCANRCYCPMQYCLYCACIGDDVECARPGKGRERRLSLQVGGEALRIEFLPTIRNNYRAARETLPSGKTRT
jgi:hypothetical protein